MTHDVQNQTNLNIPPNDRILRWPEVKQRVGISRSYAYHLISQRKFPAQIKIGERASGWLESEINDFIKIRTEFSRNGGES
jgi:prophage regulatory protein